MQRPGVHHLEVVYHTLAPTHGDVVGNADGYASEEVAQGEATRSQRKRHEMCIIRNATAGLRTSHAMEPTFCVKIATPPEDVLRFVKASRNPGSHAMISRNGVTLSLCHFADKYSVLSVTNGSTPEQREYGRSIGFRAILRETLVKHSVLSHLDLPKLETWLDDTPICKRPRRIDPQHHGNLTRGGGPTDLTAYPHPSAGSSNKRAREPDTREGEEEEEPESGGEELPELLAPTHVRTKHYSRDGKNKLRYVITNLPKPTRHGDRLPGFGKRGGVP